MEQTRININVSITAAFIHPFTRRAFRCIYTVKNWVFCGKWSNVGHFESNWIKCCFANHSFFCQKMSKMPAVTRLSIKLWMSVSETGSLTFSNDIVSMRYQRETQISVQSTIAVLARSSRRFYQKIYWLWVCSTDFLPPSNTDVSSGRQEAQSSCTKPHTSILLNVSMK